jgi:crotonobetainyl-CoA:carnitine CoA-transferase CaiB-like acyl-CoA transferase
LAAIRHRDLTGEGQVIDATLLDSMLDVVGPGAAIAHRTGVSDQRIGSRLWFSAPRNVYECSDGWICMSGSADSVAKRILKVVGGDVLENDPRFATNADRIANVDALDALISAWTSTHTWRVAVQTLADAGAAAGPVYSAEQLIADEHVVARGSLAMVNNPDGDGELLQSAPTPRLSRTPGAVRHAGLGRGASTEEVLSELGYSRSEIVEMCTAGTIGPLTTVAV